MTLWIILAVVAVLILYVINAFNGFVALKTRAGEAWSDIEIQLKRRYDLIPNLINTVKGYATHEKEVFERVTSARSAAMGAGSMSAKADAENMLSSTLKSLFAVAEAYPDLKANQNFLELQRELSDTENKVAYSRRFYNSNVRDLNIKVHSFPSNLIANSFGFKPLEMFEVKEAAEREVPKVQF